MSVATRFRQSLSKALSLSDIEDDEKENDTIIGKSVNFLSKLTHNSNSPEKRSKTLLIIDGKENQWANVFKSHSLHGQTYDIRVEQATLNELQVVSTSEKGANVSMKVIRNGAVVARSFRPDFVLLREYIQGADLKNDFKSFLLGLIHGLLPAVNSLTSAYSFLDKPVVYSELLKIRKRLGKERFPLIDQMYYQSFYEMLLPPSLPVVVKVGSGNSGYGKVCVASPRGFQDVASIVSMTNTYATSEQFVDGKYDLRIIKIGQRYKVYKRKSLSDSWKTNTGASSVEEIALTERYKNWADECSTLFGGLDMVCVDVIHTKDDKEYIVEVNNIVTNICPDKKEEEMKCIANLVVKRMEQTLPMAKTHQNHHHHHHHSQQQQQQQQQSSQGNTLTDAIQLISGPPSPIDPRHMEQKNSAQMRAESAPPYDLDAESRNTFKRNGNGPLTDSNTSLNSDKGHVRKGSLAGRIFSALESS